MGCSSTSPGDPTRPARQPQPPRSVPAAAAWRRTRSVSAAKSAAVTGRAGRNVGGASHPAWSAAGRKTPSVTHAWRCTWLLSAEPKRCRKEMPPCRGRDALGVLAASGTPAAAHNSLSTSSRKIFVSAATARGFPPGEPTLEVVRHDLAERRLLGPAGLVTAGRRGAAMGTASDSRGKPCDRGDHGRTGRWTAVVNGRTLSAGRSRSPPAVRKAHGPPRLFPSGDFRTSSPQSVGGPARWHGLAPGRGTCRLA
jgi:hypothetical protein